MNKITEKLKLKSKENGQKKKKREIIPGNSEDSTSTPSNKTMLLGSFSGS